MPRYNYTSTFRCWDRDNSSYTFCSSSLRAAVASARAQDPHVVIGVTVAYRIWNERQTTDVCIYAWQAEGKTFEEMYEVFDQEVDSVVAQRHQVRQPSFQST